MAYKIDIVDPTRGYEPVAKIVTADTAEDARKKYADARIISVREIDLTPIATVQGATIQRPILPGSPVNA